MKRRNGLRNTNPTRKRGSESIDIPMMIGSTPRLRALKLRYFKVFESQEVPDLN